MKKSTHALYKMLAICLLAILMIASKSSSACNANFTHTNACAGDPVYFCAVDQMAVYTWDFGDLTGSVNINHDTCTSHVYTTPGTYYVTLFVNIGAEWDYQTQVITVGTNCYNADFTSLCGGSNYMYFYDASYGASSFSWNFGDPASGVNNTSAIADPYHLFPAPGTYTVTLITSNGTTADTSIQSVVVPINCISGGVFPSIFGTCLGDSTHFTTSFTAGITSYNWNFGDPASGVNNTSSLAAPVHLYPALGVYMVTLTVSDGVTSNTYITCFVISECAVWPGDVDRNGTVNMEDIFAIGMFNGGTGTPRSTTSTTFAAQTGTDWSASTWSYMYLQTLADQKHADCNGDGIINTTDVSAIVNNYGMSHLTHNNISSMPEALPTEPTIALNFVAGSAPAGSTVTGTVSFGTAAIPVGSLYGYSFTINYDPSIVIPGSTTIDLSSNFLGNASNEIMITKDDGSGHIDAAVVRTDKVQVLNGYGQIATVTFHLKPTAFGTFYATIASSAKALSTSQFPSTVSGVQEIYHPFNLVGDGFVEGPLSVENIDFTNSVSVYPNPANDFINVSPVGNTIQEIKIMNALGQLVYHSSVESNATTTIDISAFSKGIYTINCKTENGMMVKKLSIVK